MNGLTQINSLRKYTKNFLKAINIYQILIWAIAFFYFIKLIFISLFVETDLGLSFILLFFIFGSLFLIYSNVCLLFGYKTADFGRFLKINLWANFFQIFQLSLLGFNYLVAVGVYLAVGYSYGQAQQIVASFNFFRYSIAINYRASDLIQIQFNIIPLLIFFILDKIIKSESKR